MRYFGEPLELVSHGKRSIRCISRFGITIDSHHTSFTHKTDFACNHILIFFHIFVIFPIFFSGLNSLNSCLSNGGSIMNNNNNNLLNNNLSSSTETICTSGEQPDPDYIKMFVGQVPKSMDEDQLREMFEEFGRVHSINVLRDKVTGVSKGECVPSTFGNVDSPLSHFFRDIFFFVFSFFLVIFTWNIE